MPWLYTACGCCEHCLTGWETLCTAQQNTGYSVNGGYAEFVLADPNYVGHLPKSANFVEIAPILCAGVTVYKGLKETEAKPGQWGCMSPRSISPPASSTSHASSVPTSPSTPPPRTRSPASARRSAAPMACW